MIKRFLRVWLNDDQLSQLKNREFRLRLVVGSHYEADVNVVLSFLAPGATAIDVGANIGQYTVPLARFVGSSGKVISVEPSPEMRRILQSNLRHYSLVNVIVVPYAASDTNIAAELHTPMRQGRRSFQESSLAAVSSSDAITHTTTFTLDSLALAECALIKVDTEGAELPILKGAVGLLTRFRPVLLLEIDRTHCRRFGYSPEEVVGFLEEHGYAHAVIESGVILRNSETDFVSGTNSLFVPVSLLDTTLGDTDK
jgi:FkbM family methyltransferase